MQETVAEIVFQLGTIISSRYKGTSMIQVYNITWIGSPTHHFLTKRTLFLWNFILGFRYFLVCNFVILSPGEYRIPFKMNYNAYNSPSLKQKTIGLSVWTKWFFPEAIYFFSSISQLFLTFLTPLFLPCEHIAS